MSKGARLLEKAKNSPNNFRFSELCKLAEDFGWEFRRQDGTSHRQYSHRTLDPALGGYMNFQNMKGKAVPYQVRKLLKAIENLKNE